MLTTEMLPFVYIYSISKDEIKYNMFSVIDSRHEIMARNWADFNFGRGRSGV